jgi:hypothetical protein
VPELVSGEKVSVANWNVTVATRLNDDDKDKGEAAIGTPPVADALAATALPLTADESSSPARLTMLPAAALMAPESDLAADLRPVAALSEGRVDQLKSPRVG